MAKEIKFNVKLAIDGKEQVAVITADAKKLNRAFGDATGGAARLNKTIINLNQGLEVIKNISDALGQISEKIKGYNESLVKTSQLTGLMGDDLRVVRNQAQALADTFGEDFSQVMVGANALAKGFGIEIQQAMQLIQDGFVSGANANGEFLDTLREYPRYFKEAGIGAEEFIAITTNAAKQGIFSDKGVDAIKEGNLRIREMTTATATALDNIGISSEEVQRKLQDGSLTTFKVMQMVGQKLQELPASSAAVGAAIADIFGGPGEDAGLEYLKSLSDIQLNMEAVKAQADDYSKSLEHQVKIQTEVTNGLTGIIDLSKIFAAIAPYLNTASQLGATAMGIYAVTQGFVSLNIAAKANVVVTKLSTATNALWSATSVRMNALVATLSASMKGAAVSAATLRLAIQGLMILTGVGVVIAALSAVINKFISDAEKAKDATRQLGEASANAAARERELQKQYAEIKGEITANIAKLKNFNGTRQEEAKLVDEMNSKYGATMGYFSSVAQWYEALTRNSKAYCNQLISEIRLRNLANSAAELEQSISQNEEKRKTASRTKRMQGQSDNPLVAVAQLFSSPEALSYASDYDALTAKITEQRKGLASLKSEMEQVAGISPKMEKVGSAVNRTISAATGGSGTAGKGGKSGKTRAGQGLNLQAMAGGSISGNSSMGSVGGIDDIAAMQLANVERYQAMAEKVRTWFEGGIIDADAAKSQIDQINAALDMLGAKHVEVDIDAEGAEEATSKLNGAASAVSRVGGAFASMGDSLEMPALNVAGTMAQAIASMVLSYSTAMEQAAALGPIAWLAFGATGLASLMTTIASLKNVAKYAEGGLAYGTTLGVFGEYPGASNNPEVVAPLNKLRSLLPQSGGGGVYDFHIKGTELVGVLRNTRAVTNQRSRISW